MKVNPVEESMLDCCVQMCCPKRGYELIPQHLAGARGLAKRTIASYLRACLRISDKKHADGKRLIKMLVRGWLDYYKTHP